MEMVRCPYICTHCIWWCPVLLSCVSCLMMVQVWTETRCTCDILFIQYTIVLCLMVFWFILIYLVLIWIGFVTLTAKQTHNLLSVSRAVKFKELIFCSDSPCPFLVHSQGAETCLLCAVQFTPSFSPDCGAVLNSRQVSLLWHMLHFSLWLSCILLTVIQSIQSHLCQTVALLLGYREN
jgi:hypothetical protein